MTTSTTSPVGQIWTIEGLSEGPQMADFRKFPKLKARFVLYFNSHAIGRNFSEEKHMLS